nr:MAG TPA: hypothetical protein [Caudoviricetes sp.]DAN15360.1 MAG TPA: hypothetical protein [Bacteriophage sp.]
MYSTGGLSKSLNCSTRYKSYPVRTLNSTVELAA